ncbi:centromere protein F isoform X2 [Echeneis naucrates]|uniref:centromere protein F isoform X2 n=1 Tax=Echeneis naucrates TaxID=173247 RepID=UPI001113BBB1|nr:centromere protein F-like isoform X2 [Echeneis naucrates]
MSWAEEDWTVGLSGRVLQKVKELQVHHERLSRENKQKQVQLDNIQNSLEKQTLKYEEVRGELQSVQRELQSVCEEAKMAAISSTRLTQELQTKQAQICSIEGQLDASRTLNNKLNQEVKRLEAELEKLQNSSKSADTTPFSTPCWNSTSPWEQNGSRKEERLGQRDEGQSRTLHIRRLHFSDVPTASLPRQQHKSTPHRHPSDQSEAFSAPLATFPWERDDSRPTGRRHSPSSSQTPCTDVINQGRSESGLCGKEEENRTETDISVTVSEMRNHVSHLEEELSVKAGMLKTIQNEMVQSKKELATREVSLQRVRDELNLAHARITQENERASGTEQRLKQLQEELKCQRQNAESSRLQHQQRTKELEKQHQRELTEIQKERQFMEKQHQQEVNKLNQELQQGRTLHNALQAQTDKLSLQKQALDKELDTFQEKLKWTEKQLQESQEKEAQTQTKLAEAVLELQGVALSLEQSRKREQCLEEEVKRLAEEKADVLHLLKELQEQKAVPAQPVQFCPIGQSFSPQPSYPLHSRPSPQIKRRPTSIRAEPKKEDEEAVDGKRADITTSYLAAREPGEGIDSEHITVHTTDSESSQRGGHRRKRIKEDNRSKNEAMESTFDYVLSSSSQSTADIPTNRSRDASPYSSNPEQAKVTGDLQRENTMLRSEINDVREELQKRLEDLEAQRRAEAEARTRLKQLSRKHASQSVEKEEQDKEWRAQLESERAETERLKKAMAALENEMRSRREITEQKERQEEKEKNKELEDRESEMIELTIQLKKQLSEVKAQLALEREERKREEEERDKRINTDIEKELNIKLAELQAELQELKSNRKDSLEEEKSSVVNSPLTYLTLHDDDFNSDIVQCDTKFLPSPEQHLLFCQSSNSINMLISETTEDFIQDNQMLTDPEGSCLAGEGKTDQGGATMNTRQNYLGGFSFSDQGKTLSDLQKSECPPTDWEKQVKDLLKENAKEAECAKQYQLKLEALQNQVTRQTQQLTMAFEKQSQHILGLLAELQEKESELVRQGEELQQCKQELDTLKTRKEENKSDLKSVEIIELQMNDETDRTVTPHTTSMADQNSTNQRDQQMTVTYDVETPTSVNSEDDNEALLSVEECPDSADSNNTESNHDSACVMEETGCGQYGGTADLVAQLLTLQQENQLLKKKMKDLTASNSGSLELQPVRENQEDLFKQSQNTGNSLLSGLTEQKPPSEQNDIITEGQESLLQTERRRDDVEKEHKETMRVEEEPEGVSQLQFNHPEEQVVALQMKVQALSEITKRQAEELVLWRLASQPTLTFDQLPPNQDNQDQSCAVTHCQSNQHQTNEMTNILTGPQSQAQTLTAQAQVPTQGIQESPGNVMVIRQDEFILSCSSNKLQGRMSFSSLQHSFHPSKKTASLQEHSQDTAEIDKDSEKENQEINVQQSHTTQDKDKGDSELIQISSAKMGQQHLTKDLQKVSAPNKSKATESHTGNLEPKENTSRATKEMNIINDSSDKAVRTKMKSVGIQTEVTFHPGSAAAASELLCASTQEKEVDEEDLVNPPSVSPDPLPKETEARDKMLFSGSFPIPADPARLAERIRRNRTQLSAAFDDTEYEPYGLPEVVMKGFADIPDGPSCPYIVRRGLLGTAVLPVPQKDLTQEEETD